MINLDIPDELTFRVWDDKIKFELGDLSTEWMSQSDSFIKRIGTENINPVCQTKHLTHEIRIKNILDEGITLFKNKKYSKAIGRFDEVLFYDPEYVDALIGKSRLLEDQGHFVKALRYYKRAAECGYRDAEYHKSLVKKANEERESFPKIKLNIYAGDEFFSNGEFEKAVVSYDKALEDTSKFKDKILFKLLNKKATALLKLEKFDLALTCFKKSIDVKASDYAYFGEGVSQYSLGEDLSENFKKPLKIDKNHLLKQALILNECGFFNEALGICNVLFENHFKADGFYLKMVSVKMYALGGLGEDLSECREIFEKLK